MSPSPLYSPIVRCVGNVRKNRSVTPMILLSISASIYGGNGETAQRTQQADASRSS